MPTFMRSSKRKMGGLNTKRASEVSPETYSINPGVKNSRTKIGAP
jgi:hypothetical protein